ncbi:MAG: hypothetical protein HWN67_01330 [Candidatus Helarchaeota archaeon]|nr:hypothetical protein [Candidatus Helarchaeota archaeon]
MSNEEEPKVEKNLISINGTIKHLKLEGGFYGIIGDDGNHYKPIKLAGEFKKDGLKVHIEAKERKGMISIHMWGRTIEILKIEKI